MRLLIHAQSGHVIVNWNQGCANKLSVILSREYNHGGDLNTNDVMIATGWLKREYLDSIPTHRCDNRYQRVPITAHRLVPSFVSATKLFSNKPKYKTMQQKPSYLILVKCTKFCLSWVSCLLQGTGDALVEWYGDSAQVVAYM